MAISADISDPIDDSKGGTLAWGKFQQNKKNQLLVYVDVPEGTRGKQVQVTMTTRKLKVVVLGKELLAGDLCGTIVVDESTWEMSDGKVLITLEKQEEGWWDRVVTADAAVDTSSFDDEPFMLGDMDENKHSSMRSMVRRRRPHRARPRGTAAGTRAPGALEPQPAPGVPCVPQVSRMLGDDDPTPGKAPTLDPLKD